MDKYIEKIKTMRNEDGFSLIELVVAVGILAILSVVGVVAYSKITENARKTAVQNAASEVLTGAVAYDNNGDRVEDAAGEWNDSAKENKDGDPVIEVSAVKTGQCIVVEAWHNEFTDLRFTRTSGVDCPVVDDETGSENGDDNKTDPPIIGDTDEDIVEGFEEMTAVDSSGEEYNLRVNWRSSTNAVCETTRTLWLDGDRGLPVGTEFSKRNLEWIEPFEWSSSTEEASFNSDLQITNERYPDGGKWFSGESVGVNVEAMTIPTDYLLPEGVYWVEKDLSAGSSIEDYNGVGDWWWLDIEFPAVDCGSDDTGGSDTGGSESAVMDVEFNFGFDFGMTNGYYEGQSFEWSLVRLSDNKVVKSGNMIVDNDYTHINAVDVVDFENGVSPVLSDYKIIIDGRESVIRSDSSNMQQSSSGDGIIVYDYNYVGDWGGSIS